MPARKGTNHHASKMTEAKVRAARKSFNEGRAIVVDGKRVKVTIASLARKYGITHQSMNAIVHRQTWKHVS